MKLFPVVLIAVLGTLIVASGHSVRRIEPCHIAFNPENGEIIWYGDCPWGSNSTSLTGTSASGSTSTSTSTTSSSGTSSSSGTTTSTAGSNSSTATGTTATSGTSSTATTSSTSSSATTATTGIGIGEEEEEPVDDQPPTNNVVSTALGPGRVLSWTSEDIPFVGMFTEKRGWTTSIQSIALRIQGKRADGSPVNELVDLENPANPNRYSYQIRVDSTFFKSGESLQFSFKTVVTHTRNGLVVPGSVTSETDPISALVSNKICNYHTYHPYSTKYAGTYGYQTEAGKFTAKLRNLISTNNHWSLFAPTQDKAVIGSHSGEFQLAERLKDKHVPLMIACTHGTQSGYFDSFPPARLHPQDSNYARETDENLMPIAPNNINQSLTEVANARHPLDPLGGIILYACTVLSNPNINSAGIKRSENGFAAGF